MPRRRGHRTALQHAHIAWDARDDTRRAARGRRNRLYCFVFSGGVMTDSFKARTPLSVGAQQYEILSLGALKGHKVDRLPYSLKILLENLLRFEDGVNVTKGDIDALLRWDPKAAPNHESAFTPARVIM